MPPSKPSSEAAEERHWRVRFVAFFASVPDWLKVPLALILAGLATHYGEIQFSPPSPRNAKVGATENEVYWDQDDLQKMLDASVLKGSIRLEKKMDRVAEQMEAVTNTLDREKRLQVRDQMARWDRRSDERRLGNQ